MSLRNRGKGPFIVLAIGVLLAITGFSSEDVPEAPSAMSISTILETPKSQLPNWVQVRDGILYWRESIEAYTVLPNGEKGDVECVYVPLVDDDLIRSWGSIPAHNREARMSLPVVRFTRQDLLERFPEYFSDEGKRELARQRRMFPCTFSLSSEPVHLGTTAKMIKAYQRDGFGDCTIIVPGSEPISQEDAAGMATLGVLLIVASGVWIVRRRRFAA